MNIRNTTAKERMLKKIRKALLHKRDNPFPDFEDTALFADTEDSLDVTFACAFRELGGQFIYCYGEISIIENLVLLIEKIGKSRVAVSDPSIQALLDQYGFPYLKADYTVADVEVSIVAAEALVARTGSVLLSAAAYGRKLQAFPPEQIIFARASRLYMDIRQALSGVRERYQDEMPSMFSMVTGPDCSTAIGYTATEWGHGPRQLYLFLIEDRF